MKNRENNMLELGLRSDANLVAIISSIKPIPCVLAKIILYYRFQFHISTTHFLKYCFCNYISENNIFGVILKSFIPIQVLKNPIIGFQ